MPKFHESEMKQSVTTLGWHIHGVRRRRSRLVASHLPECCHRRRADLLETRLMSSYRGLLHIPCRSISPSQIWGKTKMTEISLYREVCLLSLYFYPVTWNSHLFQFFFLTWNFLGVHSLKWTSNFLLTTWDDEIDKLGRFPVTSPRNAKPRDCVPDNRCWSEVTNSLCV